MSTKVTTEYTLTRGVQDVLPNKEQLAKLMKKKKITLYQGFDPSSPNLHIGHMIGVRKLAQFQKLGHKVIFLIGDFTGMIGDPTDKSAARVKLTKREVKKNAEGWKKQIKNLIDFEGENPVEVKYNSEWLSKLSLEEIIELSSKFTVQQMLERDFFQDRIKNEKHIHFHEFLYPLMQGYDSVAMNVDLEVGGNDQLFNMMAGRSLMKKLENKEKFVLTMKLMTDPTGKKMGKSEGNTINLTDSPEDMFGKIMALPDELLKLGFELLTDLTLDSKIDPMQSKKSLAEDVVSQVHGKSKAKKAKKHFEETFQKSSPQYEKKLPLKNNLVSTIAPFTSKKSVSDAKRYVSQGAVTVNGKVVKNPALKVKVDDQIKVGAASFGTVVEK